jgi:hypothetical protein
MKKNKIFSLFIVLCFTASFLYSQSPGYMGKRLVVGYGFYFSPALFGSDGAGKTIIGRGNGNAENGTIALNILHEGFLEYALSKRFMLGLSAKFYKTTYDNNRSISANLKVVDQYNYSTNYSYSGAPEGLIHISGVNYALYGKLFNRGYIAPWGRYMIFGINVKTYTCTYNPDEMYIPYKTYNNSYGSVPPSYSDFGPLKQKYTKYDILFGFGRTRVIFNRVTLDYGFNTNIIALFSTFFDVVTESDGIFNSTPTGDKYISAGSPWRVRGVNRFNAFLKVGVLLF